MLICDDDPVARAALVQALQAESVEVVGVAEDGRQALALLDDAAPDVVLMDVVMAGMDGMEAAARIAAQRPEVDCVLMTATPDAAASADGLAAGAAAYLPKQLIGLGRLPQTLAALRGDPEAVQRRVTRRLVAGLPRTWPAALERSEWLRLELAAGGERRQRPGELLEALEATGDPRVAALAARLQAD